MSGPTGRDIATATENLRIATSNRDIALNSVNVMKTYVASVEATLVAQQFASEGGAAAHWAQVTKFEESIRDPAAIRLKTEVPTESADKIAFTDATSAALAQDNIVRPLDVQLKNANDLVNTTQQAAVNALNVQRAAEALSRSTISAANKAQKALCDLVNSADYRADPGFLYNQLEGKKLQDVANATREAAINAIKACKEATDIHNSCANTYTNAIASAKPIREKDEAERAKEIALGEIMQNARMTWEKSKATLDKDQMTFDGAMGQIQVASIAAWKDHEAFTKDLEDSKAILVTRQAALATEQALVDAAQSKSTSLRFVVG